MNPEPIPDIAGLRRALAPLRRAGAAIGLVPTMGALHAGHGALLERARRECGCVVASIFVNPIQFNDPKDFARYPRDLRADLEFCAARGVDWVFAPPPEEMYPQPQSVFVEVAGVSEGLEGAFRPGHFRGVATVVMKLFQVAGPDRAYFGEKDAQQLAVIRRMAAQLDVPVEIVAVPTVREPDGLALSSRNRLLGAAERRIAPVLHQALERAAAAIAAGARSPEEARRPALGLLVREPAFRVEYFEVVDPDGMQPVERISGEVRIVTAAWLGGVRLIDNVLVSSI